MLYHEKQGLDRRLFTLAMWGRYYAERLRGYGYPREADAIPALLTALERQTLYRLACSLPPQAQIVEIGSFKGGSTYCLAAGAAPNGATIHAIDTFQSDNMSESVQDDNTLAQFQRHTQPFAASIVIHQGLSQDRVGDLVPPIDLLFVDGDHSWEGVTADLGLYTPLMRDNGILIMHDIAYPPCTKALKEIVLPAQTRRLALLPNMYAGRIRPADIRLP